MAVRARARDFRTLGVWEKSHRLTLEVYRLTRDFPREELFGLTSQMRRSASSVPTNLAEGCGRGGGDLPRFCRIASGSASELEYHLLLARDLELISTPAYERLDAQVQEVKRMLASFINKVTEES